MVLLMLAATCWGVLQLAVLGLGARTVRMGTLLLALAAGCYACGVTAVLGELAYTRIVHMAASSGTTSVPSISHDGPGTTLHLPCYAWLP